MGCLTASSMAGCLSRFLLGLVASGCSACKLAACSWAAQASFALLLGLDEDRSPTLVHHLGPGSALTGIRQGLVLMCNFADEHHTRARKWTSSLLYCDPKPSAKCFRACVLECKCW